MTVLAQATAQLELHFIWIDWLVVVGYLVLTTVIGHLLAGKQATIRDFFLGGRKLPWYAVAGSSIATEISAVTFISVPAVVFAAGGNFTYMQLGIIAGILSRIFVAFVLVPAYYKKLIYSPYDYMGNQLGGGSRGIMTALFSFGGVLAQASRVYLTAIVLELILAKPLASISAATHISPLVIAIVVIGLFAVLWTVIGGIATVIWTDVILFAVFVAGGLTAIFVIAHDLNGGFGELFGVAYDAGKMKLFDLDFHFSPVKEFTIWTALIGTTFGNVGAYGTDQLMAQRIFCCKNEREAKKAVLASYVGQLVTLLMLCVGAGLFTYYKGPAAVAYEAVTPKMRAEGVKPESLPMDQWAHPLEGVPAEKFQKDKDNIFPVFILSPAIPPGLTGLMIAGIFAAAISSFDSILAALSQTSINALYLPFRRKKLGLSESEYENLDDEPGTREAKHIVLVSRLTIVVWALLLCVVAVGIGWYKDRFDLPILSVALGLSSWVGGALLAAFFLAWLPLKVNGRGLVWSGPLAVICVSALRFHEVQAQYFYLFCGLLLLVTWVFFAATGPSRDRANRLMKSLILVPGAAMPWLISRYVYFNTPTGPQPLAWTWWAMVGCFIAFTFGYLLADAKKDEPDPRGFEVLPTRP